MNENKLAAQLLQRAAEQGTTGAGADAAAQIADYVIQKDRRRIRNLSVATIGLWLITALLITTVLLPMLAKVNYHAKVFAPELAAQSSSPTPGAAAYKLIYGMALVSTFIASISTFASLIAAICTVWLVLIVRRSTLNQINLTLSSLTDQLKRLTPN